MSWSDFRDNPSPVAVGGYLRVAGKQTDEHRSGDEKAELDKQFEHFIRLQMLLSARTQTERQNTEGDTSLNSWKWGSEESKRNREK
jgi:hypothetical protein